MKATTRNRIAVLTVGMGLAIGAIALAEPASTTQPASTEPTTQPAATPTSQPASAPTTLPTDPKALTDYIVHQSNYVSYYQGDTGRADVQMTIVDSRGGKRNREMTILRWDAPHPDADAAKTNAQKRAVRQYTGEQKFYVYFHRPADVNKMTFLVWKHLDQADDRWLYLPALDLVKRISAADKRTSFVGSHFFYEDVSGRNVNLDHHKLAETTDNYYVLDNTPKDPDSVEFARYRMWIHKETFLVVRTSYYDANDNEYRRYEALGVKTIQGHPTVVKSRMTDLRDKSYTLLEYADVQYDVGLTEDIFTQRYLRRAPRKYLK